MRPLSLSLYLLLAPSCSARSPCHADKEAFEWFSGLLSELEQNNVGNFLEINVFLTARVSKEGYDQSVSKPGFC